MHKWIKWTEMYNLLQKQSVYTEGAKSRKMPKSWKINHTHSYGLFCV